MRQILWVSTCMSAPFGTLTAARTMPTPVTNIHLLMFYAENCRRSSYWASASAYFYISHLSGARSCSIHMSVSALSYVETLRTSTRLTDNETTAGHGRQRGTWRPQSHMARCSALKVTFGPWTSSGHYPVQVIKQDGAVSVIQG